MKQAVLRLVGPRVQGLKVNGPLLRDLLGILIDGSQRALRLRTQGRSLARGKLPNWIASTTEFIIQIKEGSTVLQIDAPTLLEADEEHFKQTNLFPDVDVSRSAIDYLVDSLNAVSTHDKESVLYDRDFLQVVGKFDDVFSHGITAVELIADGTSKPLRVTNEITAEVRELKVLIPKPQAVSVAGYLDQIRHSDSAFVLRVGTERIKGIAEKTELASLWGKHVFVSGRAQFSANGKVQYIDAGIIRPASEQELHVFEYYPESIGIAYEAQPQGSRSGINAIIGKWPGDETDAELTAELDRLS